ncbi:PTS sugar transporter subunit IIC [Halanaerobium praevalens]|uniref:Permease IIC component n=1 Tax=Halanaerobium praevalens (strain ATCC 33744 / DSM 2228 / GSL) TaxID=572479 RepID=E3DMV5_HALPG|nr:PTS transporter subunit EIIC [Halanaerobium praevalens]ADO77444.1 PTS system, lactose/cellobiose family IIC subunit [Halanaerobium praevalens DSM 2228]
MINNLFKLLENKFVPLASKFGSQRHLLAIRDAFISIMPLAIIGSLAILVNNFPISSYQAYMLSLFGSKWASFSNYIYSGTFAIMSLLIVFSISYNLAQSYDNDPLLAALISFSSFIITIIQADAQSFRIPFRWLDSSGLLVAILVGILATEIYVKMMNLIKARKRKVKGAMTPILNRYFLALIPTTTIFFIFALIRLFFAFLGIENIIAEIYSLIQLPLMGLANNLFTALFIVLVGHFFWFLGLHGTNILEPVIQTLYLPALQENIQAASNNLPIPNIFTKPFFDSFVYLGGSGTTLSLVIAIYLFSNSKRKRDLMKLSSTQAIFNINEPILYGLPIVMSPVYLIPFILTPLILTLSSYFAILIGLVPKTIALVPWGTPPIISGFLVTGSFAGSFLQIFNILIGVLIYFPFLSLAERIKEGG